MQSKSLSEKSILLASYWYYFYLPKVSYIPFSERFERGNGGRIEILLARLQELLLRIENHSRGFEQEQENE